MTTLRLAARLGAAPTIALALLGAGCRDDAICSPGALSACFLPDGTLGAQQCNADGTAFSACAAVGASSQRGCERLSQACCPALPAELVDGCDATASQADDAACDDYLAAAAAVDLCTGASGEGGAGASGAASYGPICAGLLNGCCAELPAPLEAACHATGFRGNERMCHQFLENEAKDNGFCAGVDHADESCDYLTERCCPSLPAGARERCAELAGEGDAARCIDYLGGASDAGRCTGRAAEEPFIAATCGALLEACCGTLEPDLAATCDLAALSGSRARCESFRSSIRGFGLCLDAGGEGGSGGDCGDTSSDVNNCGFCGNVCGDQHATPSCAAGVCSIACDLGYDDCDGDPATGCEADLMNDVDHCGACGRGCSDENATSSCIEGACVLRCDDGYADCDGTAFTGCEVELASNPFHCGACGNSCEGGLCENGTCGPPATPLAAGLAVPSALVAGDSALYLVGFHAAGGLAVRIDKVSGGATCLANAAPPGPGGCSADRFEDIALAGADVIVTASTGVLRYPSAGGAATSLTTSVPDPWAVVTDGSDVWFTSLSRGGIYRIGAAASGQSAQEITGVISEPGGALASDAEHLYWARTNGTVVKLRKDGTERRQISSGQVFDTTQLTPHYLALDDDHLFLTSPSGLVLRLAKDGSSLAVIADDQPDPAGIAVDPGADGAVYWVNRVGSIRSVAKTGGDVTTLAVGQRDAIAIAVDGQSIYWATRAGDVRSLAK